MTVSTHTLAELLRAPALQRPEEMAILAPDRPPLTYGRLLQHLGETSARLRVLGIGPGDRVALVLPNGPEMATAFIAVAACAASAPLNPAYRREEFEFYLGDLRAKALILPAGQASPAREVAGELGIAVFDLIPRPEAGGLFELHTAYGAGASPAPETPAMLTADEDAVALILHTSGTTSRPKMVPLSQRNLCASAHHIVQSLQLTPADRCLNVMPLFHIHGLVAALLASLAAGGSVVCTPGFASDRFFDWLARSNPTWYTAVPTMHQAICAQAERLGKSGVEDRLPSLRFVRSSSASLPPSVMAELERVFDAPVIEAYGMTEASHQMASNPLPPLPRKPGSVGLPAGPEIAIMAEDSAVLMPMGERGEVVIRGANVTSGYLANPEAAAKTFVAGWFRTGDQGMFDSDGYLFLTGRLKEIINRGGEKISPREVDEVLLEHPGVAQAVTFALPHPTLGEDVAAAVVLRPGGDASPQQLRAHAFARLAAFKVPSQIVIVQEIPKGPTGKVQRIGLYERLADQIRPAYVAPRDEIEQTLAAMWMEVLEAPEVGAFDNFFALGGDSLAGARLVTRIGSVFEVPFPLDAIFREPTVAGQAQFLVAAVMAFEVTAPDDLSKGGVVEH